jgi:hypothetical protein
MSNLSICIKPQQFNESNLIINEPKTYEYKNNNRKIITSDICYLNDKNECCKLYITLPPMQGYGPFPSYDFNTKIKTYENIKDYQICYAHSIVEKMFAKINKVCQDRINEFVKLKLINKKCILKPIFNDQNKAYFKLNVVRDNQANLLKILTNITDTTSVPIDPITTFSNPGIITPMIHIQKIYFGSHGNTEYGSSVQSRVVRLRFTETSTSIPDFQSDDEL